MAGKERKSFNISNPDKGKGPAMTPSDDLPLTVALSVDSIGPTTTSIEELMTKVIGQAIYGGDFCTSAKNVARLRTATQNKKSIGDILFKAKEFLDKNEKPIEEALKKSESIFKAVSSIADDIGKWKKSEFQVKIKKKKGEDDDKNDKDKENLRVVLEGDNLDPKSIEELNDFVDNNEDFENLTQSLIDLAKEPEKMKQFVESLEPIQGFFDFMRQGGAEINTQLDKTYNTVSKLSSEKFEFVNNAAEALKNLSEVTLEKIDTASLDSIFKTIAIAVSDVRFTDGTIKLTPEVVDKISLSFLGIEDLAKTLSKIDVAETKEKLEKLVDATELLREVLEEKIAAIKPESIENIIEIFDTINKMQISDKFITPEQLDDASLAFLGFEDMAKIIKDIDIDGSADEEKIQTISDIFEIVNKMKITGDLITPEQMDTIIASMGKFEELSKTIGNVKFDKSAKQLSKIKESLTTVEEVNEKSIAAGAKSKKAQESLLETIKTMEGTRYLGASIAACGGMSGGINKGKGAMKEMFSAVEEVGEEAEKIDPSPIKKGQASIADLTKLVVAASLVLIIGALIVIYKPEIIMGALKFGLVLGAFLFTTLAAINGAHKLFGPAQSNLADLAKLIAVSALVMIAGAFIVLYKPEIIMGAFGFGIVLALFLFMVLSGINLAHKLCGEAQQNLGDLARLIAVAALVMVVGAVIVLYKPEIMLGAFGFGLALSAFLFLVMMGINLPCKLLGAEAKVNLRDVAILIVAATLVMLIGAAFILGFPKMVAASIAFTLLLAFFIFAIMLAICIPMKLLGKEAKLNLKDVAILVVACAIVMMVGAAFILEYPQLVEACKTFTALFFWFMMAILVPLALAGPWIAPANESIRELYKLVLVAGAVLLAGGFIFMKWPKMKWTVMLFAIILQQFIKRILKAIPITKSGQIIAGYAIMKGLSKIVKTSAAMLMIGGFLFMKYPAMIGTVPMFATILWGFVFGMMKILAYVAKHQKTIFQVLPAMEALSHFTKQMTKVMMMIALCLKIANPLELLAGVGILALIMVAAGGIVFGLAMLERGLNTMGLSIAIVAGLLVPLGTAMVLFSLSMIGIAFAMKIMAKIPPLNPVVLLGNVSTLTMMAVALLPLAAMSIPLMFASAAVNMIVMTMAKAALAVQLMSSLTIPVYEGTKIVAYKHLTKEDFKNAAENTKTIVTTIGNALLEVYSENPDIFGFAGIFTMKTKAMLVAETAMMFGPIMASCALGVQAMSSLNVATSWDAKGKPNKFEKLQNKDFTNAAMNTKKIVVTIGKALIDVYEENPEVFKATDLMSSLFGNNVMKTPIMAVVTVAMQIGKLMSSIAKGVQAMGTLKIPTKWDKNGKPIEFERMTNEEIIQAGINTRIIAVTIIDGLLSIFDERKEVFADDINIMGIVNGNDGSKSPLSKVMGVALKVGKLISSVAKGVQAMGNLKIATKWDKNGKPVDFERMTNEEIVQAGINARNVVVVIIDSLMDLYTERPELWTGEKKFLGEGKSPVQKVLKVALKVGKIISSIAHGVEAFAKGKIPTAWDKNGKPIQFRTLNDSDYTSAANNVSMIITNIITSLCELYEAHPDMFEEPEGGFFDSKETPIAKVIGVSMKISKIVSSIGEAVIKVAAGQIPIAWDKNGKAIKFETISDKHFTLVGANTIAILTCMAEALLAIYKIPGIKEMLEEPGGEGIEGLLNAAKDSPMTKVVKVAKDIAEVVGMVGKSVGDIAKLQVPIAWDKNGKAIKYETLTTKHFAEASMNVSLLLQVMANGLLEIYNVPGLKELLEEPSAGGIAGMFGKTKPSKIDKVVHVARDISLVIANVAKAVGDMAKLQIATKWDAKGNPIEYRGLGEEDFKLASENVAKVIKTLAEGLVGIYDDPKTKELFEDVPTGGLSSWLEEKKESKLSMVMRSIGGMGDLIKGITEGVIAYATMQIPTKWDKNGNPIEYKSLSTEDQVKAAINIGFIITTVGSALIDVYTKNPTMFGTPWYQNPEEDNETPFGKVCRSCATMGEMIKNIADGIYTFAKMDAEGIQLEGKGGKVKIDYTKASTSISTIVTTIGKALVDTFSKHKDLFDLPPLKETSVGLFSAKTEYKPNPSDPPMLKIVNSCSAMGGMITSIADAIIKFAELDAKGIEIDGVKYTINYQGAATNIGKIVTTIGKTLIELSETKYFADLDYITKIINVVSSATNTVSKIVDIIKLMAENEIPTTNADGTVTNKVPLTKETLESTATMVTNIISCIAKGIVEAWQSDDKIPGTDQTYKQMWDEIAEGKMFDAVRRAIDLVSKSAENLLKLTNGTFKVGTTEYTFDPDTTWTKAAGIVKNILTTIAEGIGEAHKSVSTLSPTFNYFGFSDPKHNPITTLMDCISYTITKISDVAYRLLLLGGDEIPIYDENWKVKTKIPGGIERFVTAAEIIKYVITTVAEGISRAQMQVPAINDMFITGTNPPDKMLEKIIVTIGVIYKNMFKLANIGLGNVLDEDNNVILSGVTKETILNATDIIYITLTSIGKSIANSYDMLNSLGLLESDGIFDFIKKPSSKLDKMFSSINMIINLLHRVSTTLSIYSTGNIALINSSGVIVAGDKIDFDAANSHIYASLMCVASSICDTAKKFEQTGENSINAMTTKFEGGLAAVNVVAKFVDVLAPKIQKLQEIAGVSLYEILSPIISDMGKILSELGALDNIGGENSGSGNFIDRVLNSIAGRLSGPGEGSSGFQKFIFSATSIVHTAKFAKTVDLRSAFDDINYALRSTCETLEGFSFPDNFPAQVKELDKFVRSINSMKVPGADALTKLLVQLNKLGVNMGNMDKLVNAITDNLSKALTGLKKAIDEINKTMIEDAKRKEQHKKEIKNSVKEVQTLLNKEMTVIVKPDQSNSGASNAISADSSAGSNGSGRDGEVEKK